MVSHQKGVLMKKVVLSVLLFSVQAFASLKIEPQSGDRFTCVDSLSGYTYLLEIKDLGDEEAHVVVLDQNKKFLRVYKGFYGAHVELSEESVAFQMMRGGQVVETIEFENYDLDRAVYYDLGDSRSVSCIYDAQNH